MSDTLDFPANNGKVKDTYYAAYYEFVINWAMQDGIDVNILHQHDDTVWCGTRELNAFSCRLNGQPFMMDFSDFRRLQVSEPKYTYFKWHYWPVDHCNVPNIYPLTPLLQFNVDKYFKCRDEIMYDARGEIILNAQRPRLKATERRNKAQKILHDAFPGFVDTQFLAGQLNFWPRHKNILVAVAIPGAREDILDRGQVEEMGLGVCVISPYLSECLHYNHLVPWIHYVPIKYDFSDLVAKVKWCKSHRDECAQIGRNAQKLFDETCLPRMYWRFIKQCLARR